MGGVRQSSVDDSGWTHPVEFVRVVALLVPREFETTTPQLRSVCLTSSSRPLSLEELKAALVLQRRIRTRKSFSRLARFYGVEPAPHSSSSCP
jgi:hypothetical protein